MKRSITDILVERFGDPIGKYAGDAPAGVRSIEEATCPECGMEDCECDHANEAAACTECGYMKVEGNCGCTHEMNEAKKRKKKKRGLWANIHAKRERGEAPAKPGEEGYPKTLNIGKKK
jgi:hypothetical protein